MPDNDDGPPFDLFSALHKSFLQHLKAHGVLDVDEIPLFEWYEQEHSKTLDRMFAEERAFIKEQQAAGVDVPNDSGIVAVEYYVRRLRNADVIQLTSLLESFLERACDNLKLVIGDSAVVFGSDELSGNRWERFRKFLERYAHFTFPTAPWSDLRMMIDIRNKIVHDNGAADWDRPGGEYLFTIPGITIEDERLVVEREFVLRSLMSLKAFVETVTQQIRSVVDRAQRPRVVSDQPKRDDKAKSD